MVSIVFAGVGGQGLITIASILGRGAIVEGKHAIMTELHGMSQRGGSISVEVRIGEYRSAIIPARTADAIVGFEEMETVRNINKLKDDGLILLNRRTIHPIELTMIGQSYPVEEIENYLRGRNIVFVEADEIAMKLGNKKVTNAVMLGALFATHILGLREDSLLTAIREALDRKYWDVNIAAFSAGKESPIIETEKVA
jgi:indolepyruvate ferredoxin oxidoreductase beta subunit